MTNEYIPEVGTVEVEPVAVELEKKEGVINYPAVGTRMRVRLGESVLVGEVLPRYRGNGPYIRFAVDGEGFAPFREVTLWVQSGWKFEVLERELVDA